MLDDTISCSPEKSNSTIHNTRVHRKNKRSRFENETNDYCERHLPTIEDMYAIAPDAKVDSNDDNASQIKKIKQGTVQKQYYCGNYDPFAEQKRLAIADRLHSAQAPQSQCNSIKITTPGFQRCDNLEIDSREIRVDTKITPKLSGTTTQFGISDTELIDFCAEAEAVEKYGEFNFKFPIPKTPKKSIVEEILSDFCSSPTPSEELRCIENAAANVSPRFRFDIKSLRTYKRANRTLKSLNLNNVMETAIMHSSPSTPSLNTEDCLSDCSSELSMQEDFGQLIPTEAEVDLNKTQKLCENLMNLSAYFTQKSEEEQASSLSPKATEVFSTALSNQLLQSQSVDVPPLSQLFTQIYNLQEMHLSKIKHDSWHSTDDFIGFVEDDYGNDSMSHVPNSIDLPASNNTDIENTTFLCIPQEFEKKYTLYFEQNDDEISHNVVEDAATDARESIDDWNKDNEFFVTFNSQKIVNDGAKYLEHKAHTHKMQDINWHKRTKTENSILQDEDWNTDCDFLVNIQTQEIINNIKEETDAVLNSNVTDNTKVGIPAKARKISTSHLDIKTESVNVKFSKDEMPSMSREALQESTKSIVNQTEFIGFRTASHKVIKISAKAQQEAANMLKDITEKPIEHEEDMLYAVSDKQQNKESMIDKGDHLNDAIHLDGNVKFSKEEMPSMSREKLQKSTKSIVNQTEFIGFRTASHKVIKISAKAQQEAANMLKDITEKPIEHEEDMLYAVSYKQQNKESMIDKGDHLNDAIHLDKVDVINNKFHGFCTASNKTVKISAQAQRKAANIFKELPPLPQKNNASNKNCLKIELLDIDHNQNKIEALGSRQNLCTHSNKLISQRENQNENVPKQLPTISLNPDSEFVNKNTEITRETSECAGFFTASCKQITISEAAKRKATTILQNLPPLKLDSVIDPEDVHEKTGANDKFTGFCTASRKQITISEEAKKKAANILQNLPPLKLESENDLESLSDQIETDEFKKFSGASYKRCTISEEAKKKATTILQNLSSPQVESEIDCPNKDTEVFVFKSEEIKSTPKKLIVTNNVDENTRKKGKTSKTAGVTVRTSDDFSTISVQTKVEGVVYETHNKSFNKPSTDNNRSLTTSCLEETPQAERGKLKLNLTDLTTCSPFAKATTPSVIARKNLLSLSKRRKNKKLETQNQKTEKLIDTGIATPNKITLIQQAVDTPKLKEYFDIIPENASTPRLAKLPIAMPQSTLGIKDTDFQRIKWDNCNDLLNNMTSKTTINNISREDNVETTVSVPPSPQERIARLQIYGDPPSISPIQSFIRSNCRPSGLRRSRSNISTLPNNKSSL